MHRLTRRAFRVPSRRMLKKASADQRNILDLLGPPDYERRRFKSFEGEYVNQWAYLDNHQIFQFIKGELVYEGPLTDLELLLIRHGYPDRLVRTFDMPGPIKTRMYYRNIFDAERMESYFLVDDWLMYGVSGE